MGSVEEARIVTRRFLQCRRRGPAGEDEVGRLLTPDAVFVRIGPTGTRTATGVAAITRALEEGWGGRAAGQRLAIIRHAVLDDGTATGHWRREGPDGAVVNGVDTYTLRDGLICRIVEETIPTLRAPGPVPVRR